MTGSSAVGFACASQIAADRKGDCRQHAMLTAALCRASGVPSRTAIGLVYVPDDDGKGAVLGFHMWTEVWIKGQWLGIDATLGQGGVGPGHLKISDHSWADTQTLAPLLPVTRVMGKLKVEVVKVEE
jgi:transglutaminase-like putative cysteine protease